MDNFFDGFSDELCKLADAEDKLNESLGFGVTAAGLGAIFNTILGKRSPGRFPNLLNAVKGAVGGGGLGTVAHAYHSNLKDRR